MESSSSLRSQLHPLTRKVNEGFQNNSNKGNQNTAAEFIKLVERLQLHFQSQLRSCLVAMNKFTKSIKYFIQALRSVKPQDSQCIISLSMVEAGLQSCQHEYGEANSWTYALESFLINVKNFRLLRQQVKMEIYMRLKKQPQDLENAAQRRSRGEIEVLLNTWCTLVNVDHDLSRLEHASVGEYLIFFETEQEMNSYKGVLSLLPKLSDIVNRIDFLLTKYQM
ncbi:uncharacterized protein [Antedon mediterranea]|uniref:uncharacterized protein n=1 Tax=Antedon mediterranea TaxID=105859 RepID=UPI003AF42C0A